MHGSFTSTASQTNTFTDARLRAVMPEIGADFYNMAGARLVTFEKAQSWTEDLTFILQNQAAYGFQIQLTYPNGQQIALDYRVSSDGSIRESSTAGGVDYYVLPAGTRPVLFVNLNYSAAKISIVTAYMRKHGWGFDGHPVHGDVARERAYSKDGYGVIRGKIGVWP
jgi:hypothetical protein